MGLYRYVGFVLNEDTLGLMKLSLCLCPKSNNE